MKAERLPTFLNSDCYFEYRLAHVLSQVRLMDSKGRFVLTKVDYTPRPVKSKKKQEEVGRACDGGVGVCGGGGDDDNDDDDDDSYGQQGPLRPHQGRLHTHPDQSSPRRSRKRWVEPVMVVLVSMVEGVIVTNSKGRFVLTKDVFTHVQEETGVIHVDG